MKRVGIDRKREGIAVGVGAGQRDLDGPVRRCAHRASVGCRGIVYRLDVDNDGGWIGVREPVVGAEGEAVAPVEVGIGSIGQIGRGPQDGPAARRGHDRERQTIFVRV